MFDGTLLQGLAVQLEQSPFLSLVSEERIQQMLRLMGRQADARLTPEIAREICARTGSAAVLEGGLVAVGQSGLYDEWRRRRNEPGLRGLVDGQEPAREYEETVQASILAVGPPARKEVGKGRTVYVPSLDFDGPLPPMESYFTINNRFWKRPRNWTEIVEATRWAARDDFPVIVSGPEYLVANVVEQQDQQRRSLHLVNYNARNAPQIQSIEVKCSPPQGQTIREVRVYAPDEEAPQTLTFQAQGTAVSFVIPQLRVYSVVSVSW